MAVPTRANLTLNSKQQSVLLVLWPCLKAPPRIDVQIGPEGIKLGATFDRRAPGMVFETVRSDHDQITVAADLDVADVEVDFEKLKAAAGLASVEEAAEVWESIKEVVSAAAASATPVSHWSRDKLELQKWDVPRPTLLEQLHTAARDIQLFVYKAQLENLEAQLESAAQTAATSVAPSESRHRPVNDRRLQVAKDSVRRVSSMPAIRTNTQALTAWFIRGLFGDRGLENFYTSQRQSVEQQRSKQQHTASKQRDLPLDLMDRVLESYQQIRDSPGEEACGEEAYQDRLRLYACFFDNLTNLRCKFWQKGSAEQRALLRYADDKGFSISLQQVAWIWLTEKTGQSRGTIDDAVWKGRQIRTMIALFGGGVLYFMDSRLESELETIKGGSGILISVMKAIDVLLGHELRTLCETAHKALSGGSRAADEVRAKLSLITATSLDGRTMSKIDTLLADVSHGRVAMSMELEDHDEVYAGKFM